ncbi:MAG: hypothetical protein V3W44_10215 [Dehalococcoidales bacterium]
MAVVFFDGFESANSDTTLLHKWELIRLGSPVYEATSGRRSSRGIRITNPTTRIFKNIPALDTYIAGGAFKPTTGQSDQAIFILFLTDIPTASHIEIRGETDGNISVTRSGTQLGITTDNPLTFDDFQFIEARVFIDNSAGSVEVRLNGSTILNLTSVDTRNGSSTEVSFIGFSGHTGGTGVAIDDVYVLNESGDAPQNTFLGDIRIDTIKPSADGGLSQLPTLFPITPTTSFDKVDEEFTDDDTTYIESTAVNQVSTFAYEDAPAVVGGATVLAVQVATRIRKTEIGPRNMTSLQRFSAANTVFQSHGVPTENTTFLSVHPTNPRTGSAWGETEIDALEVGLEVL